MPTQITNQATLTFQYGDVQGSATSNLATTTLQEALTLSKNSLSTAYEAGDEITYILSINNSGETAQTNINVEDNLATYTIGENTVVTPLTYIGPAYLYINGVLSAPLTPIQGISGVTFTIPSLPAGATAMILYRARVADRAQLDVDSELVNTATINLDGENITDTHTIAASEYADIRIIKSMSPNPVTDGGTLSYTFTIYNYGNTAATNVVLADTFNPIPTGITVTLNGTVVDASDYSYQNGNFRLPASNSALEITVPAATFSQDATTGVVTTTPGTATIVISGTI